MALVDDIDAALAEHRWCTVGGYAVRRTPRPNPRTLYMHRVILEAPKGCQVDHINGNRLDNRRENIRLCSQTENIRAYMRPSAKTSPYRGVCWASRPGRWLARITVNYRTIHIGHYHTELEAAAAYDAAARLHFGTFAQPNLG